MSVMPVFGAERHSILLMKNAKKWKNSIDKITGGG